MTDTEMLIGSREVPYEEIDVVVAGASAGVVAAIKAADFGAKVICLDKLGSMDPEKITPVAPADVPGGWGNCTAKSGGTWYYISNIAPDKPVLARTAGGTEKGLLLEYDEKTTTLERYKELSMGRTDVELAKTLFERSMTDARWLREQVGLLQKKTVGVTAGKTTMGRHILPDLYEAARKRGVKILFEHKVLNLLTDTRGRVTGLRAMTPEGLKDYRAKATVLATGSFEGNQEMKLKYLGPEKAYMMLTGCPTNTGDGLKMAMELGARLVNMSAVHIRTTDAVVYGRGPSRSIPNVYARGLYINKQGKRFVNECRESDDIANCIAHQPDQKVYLVFDEKIKTQFIKEYDNYIAKTARDAYRQTTEDELMIRANTVEALAGKMDVPSATLRSTIDEFNAAVKDGKALGIPYPKVPRSEKQEAVKIDQPPFYAHPITCALNHPLGGLKIDTRGRVINNEDKVIPGLYACGAIVNIHFGGTVVVDEESTYVSSYAIFPGLGYSFVMACLAAESALEEIRSE
jgi:succinate dehydrogenase/fumarate reductase flavoprotein subunit